jgi:O-antigen/teichoic acid export membrane protein
MSVPVEPSAGGPGPGEAPQGEEPDAEPRSPDEAPSSAPSLGRSVKSGIAWSIFTFLVTKGLAMATLLVLTRLLAPSQFGIVAAVAAVLSLIELTTDLGMGQVVIYEQEEGHSKRVDVAFTINIALTTLLTLAAVAAAPLIASFFHASGHVGLFRLAALDIFLTGLGGVHDGLLLRDLGFRTRIVTQVVNSLARACVGVTLALLGFGASALVWGMLAGTGAWAVSLWVCTDFRPTLHFDRKIARSILPYGIGASMLSLLSQVTTQVDVAVVGRVLGPRALGLYSVAYRVPSLVLENIANQVSLVAFPALSRKRVLDREGVSAATGKLVNYQSLYALPLAAGLAVQAAPIVETLFSAKWSDASGVFAAVCVMSGISASGFALGDAFKALARQRVMVGLTFIQLPVLVLTIILLAPYGITAVAWGRCANVIFWVALMMIAAARVLRIPVAVTLGAMRPGAGAAVGVALGAGAVRLWSGLPAIPELLLAGVLGALGGALALALVARPMFDELRLLVLGVVRRRTAAAAAALAEPR